MKLAMFSDPHGDLPIFEDRVNVVGVAGDIFPLEIQSSPVKSITWFNREFVPWAMGLNCDKVIFCAGNHDFALQWITNNYFRNRLMDINKEYIEECAADIVKEQLMLPKKIVYLQDSEYSYNHVKFYGTPWCPDLSNWAFYKNHEDLERAFAKIPDDCDILITHAPGTENDMGTSLWHAWKPEYGCKELTERVKQTGIRLWCAGHVHTGNHHEGLLSNGITRIYNVSIKDEDYIVRWEPTIIEI